MHWLSSAKCLILSSTGTLVAYKVRVGAAETCRADGLMCIHHNVVLCSLFYRVEVVVVHPLAVVMLAERQDISYIAALYSVVTIFVHKVVSGLHVSLVIT